MWPIIILYFLLACNNQGNCCGNRVVESCCRNDCDCECDQLSKPFTTVDDDCECEDDRIQPRGFYNGTVKS